MRQKGVFPELIISVAVSALAFSLALPNELFHHGFPPTGFVCLIPYFYALKKTDSPLKGFFLGFIFGAVFHASSSWWLANFREYALWTLGATSLLYGLFYGLWALLLRYAARAGLSAPGKLIGEECAGSEGPAGLAPFLTAMIWTMMEWYKSSGYFAFPWGLLPYTVQNVPLLIQTSDTAGIYAPGFLLALCNSALAELLVLPARKSRIRGGMIFSGGIPPSFPALFAASFLLFWTVIYGFWRLNLPIPTLRTIPMVLVQHNADQYSDEENALVRAVDLSLRGIAVLKEQGRTPAMVVWSETLLTYPFSNKGLYPSPSAGSFLEQSSIPVLTGAPIAHSTLREFANGAILIQKGKIISAYEKRQLIPFAESIPFAENVWMRRLMEKFAGFSSGWTAGRKNVVMEVSGLRFGTPICFEDAFPWICRDFVNGGAEVLINLTNDSWSQSISAELQHLAAARFRTVENRLTLLRSTNSGYTAVIDARGKIVASLPLFTKGCLAMDIPIQYGGPTIYFLLGDWLPLLFTLLFLVHLSAQSIQLFRKALSVGIGFKQ